MKDDILHMLNLLLCISLFRLVRDLVEFSLTVSITSQIREYNLEQADIRTMLINNSDDYPFPMISGGRRFFRFRCVCEHHVEEH